MRFISQGRFTWCLSTWTTTWWASWSRASYTSTRATSSLSWGSCWKDWITATRRTSCTGISSAPTSCSITSQCRRFTLFILVFQGVRHLQIWVRKCTGISPNHCEQTFTVTSYYIIWFVSCRGQIKLADFGLARLYNSEERYVSSWPGSAAVMSRVRWVEQTLTCLVLLQSALHQ